MAVVKIFNWKKKHNEILKLNTVTQIDDKNVQQIFESNIFVKIDS